MTTLDADLSSSATSAAWISRCSPTSAEPDATTVPPSAPKPPRITLTNDRFIARHMMYDRIAPEEPTRAPVTMSRLLLSMKPAAAAAHPEYEFSIDTTTGMSPPPIAATRCQPRASATTVISTSGTSEGDDRNQPSAPADATSAPRFSQLRPGSVSGADFIFADSLR